MCGLNIRPKHITYINFQEIQTLSAANVQIENFPEIKHYFKNSHMLQTKRNTQNTD